MVFGVWSSGFHPTNIYKTWKHDSFRPAFVLCIFGARLVTMNAKADGLDMARASRYGFQVRVKKFSWKKLLFP